MFSWTWPAPCRKTAKIYCIQILSVVILDQLIFTFVCELHLPGQQTSKLHWFAVAVVQFVTCIWYNIWHTVLIASQSNVIECELKAIKLYMSIRLKFWKIFYLGKVILVPAMCVHFVISLIEFDIWYNDKTI